MKELNQKIKEWIDKIIFMEDIDLWVLIFLLMIIILDVIDAQVINIPLCIFVLISWLLFKSLRKKDVL